MSDNTTEATHQLPEGTDNGNPSMEDILSSIRRIIADDNMPETASENTVDLDVNSLAGTTPEIETQDSLILDVEAEFADTDVMDLEDILVLDDEHYSDDDLAIPGSDSFEDTQTAQDTSTPDDGNDLGLDIQSVLEDSLTDFDAGILDAVITDTPETNIAHPNIVETEAEDPNAGLENIEALLSTDTETAEDGADDPVAIDLNDPILDDSLFDALDTDIDLVLDEDDLTQSTAPDIITSVEVPNPEVTSTTDNAPEVTAVLNVIDDNIADLTTPETEREQAAMEIEAILDGEDTEAQSVDDLMTSLLLDDPVEDQVVEATTDAITEAPSDDVLETEMADITAETDIDLVKSLMADLTEGELLEDPDTEDALLSPEPALSADEGTTSETDGPIMDDADIIEDVLDDILSLSLDDEEDMFDTTTVDPDDPAITDVDASISSLLQIAAAASEDAKHPRTAPAPVVLDVMPAISEPGPVVAEAETTDDDTLLTESLVTAVEEPAPEDTDSTLEDEVATPTLAIEALAAQTLALEDIVDGETSEAETVAEDPVSVEATAAPETTTAIAEPEISEPETTPEAAQVADALPAPTIDEAVLPEPDDSPDAKAETPEAEKASATPPTPEPAIPETNSAPEPKKETPEMPKAAVNDSILDEVTEAATTDAFSSLNQLVEAQTEFEESGPRVGDLVQEALRPMLKDWLDENLKNIVERAVQKEVKRISSGK